MTWKFWANRKNVTLEGIQELLTPINQQLTLLNQQFASNSEQIHDLGDQIRKLGRLQYKSGQDVQGKLEDLNSSIKDIQQWQLENETQKAQVTNLLLVWLDDFDLLSSGLREHGQDMWQQLLEKWTNQVLQALQFYGFYEIKILGASFDPKVTEAIGIIARQPSVLGEEDAFRIPYEVAEVVKRGFITNDGRLIRKAQVITYQEDER